MNFPPADGQLDYAATRRPEATRTDSTRGGARYPGPVRRTDASSPEARAAFQKTCRSRAPRRPATGGGATGTWPGASGSGTTTGTTRRGTAEAEQRARIAPILRPLRALSAAATSAPPAGCDCAESRPRLPRLPPPHHRASLPQDTVAAAMAPSRPTRTTSPAASCPRWTPWGAP